MNRTVSALILAAGKGTRMRSERPKVLHAILGRPLIRFPLELAQSLACKPIVLVLGHGADEVRKTLPVDPNVVVALQAQQRGTGDAVRAGMDVLPEFEGLVVVFSGDVPLLRKETVDALVQRTHQVGLVVAHADNPQGYGRIVRTRAGAVERIVEERDATAAERSLREINAGIYCFEAAFLRRYLQNLTSHNAQAELYLTDLISKAESAVAVVAAPLSEVAGVNDRIDLSRAAATLRAQVNREHQRAGVTLWDPLSTHIDLSVEIAPEVVIEPGCVLVGTTRIGAGSVIRAHSVLEDAVVGPRCSIGPFARLRPGTRLAQEVHLGNFVETKNAELAEGVKANHLSYLGDARVGAKTNVGAGTITCNYDGERKSLTDIGQGVFIGSDTQLVAPVRVGDGAYIGAGTTVDEDVPADSLVFTRAPRVVKDDWAKRRRAKKTGI